MISAAAKDAASATARQSVVLADVKAVPHRTRCAAHWRRVTSGVNGCRLVAQVKPGEVFVDERLASRLGVKAGDVLQVGRTRRIAQVFAEGPSRRQLPLGGAEGIDNPAPTWLPANGPGSRAAYRLRVAG